MSTIKYGRNRKSIKKELREKVSDWIESIDDEEVREKAKSDVIVTGGAIASMLLGEKVNDFDIYFKTKSSTIAVAEYYVDKFNTAKEITTAEGVVTYKPEVKLEDVVNIKGVEEERVSIYCKSSGVASEAQSVYKYFENRPENEADEFVRSLEQDASDEKGKYRPVFLSENAITLSNKVQVIIRFFGNPDEIHENYDFVHAKCYWDHSNDVLHLPADALECLLSRTLLYSGSLYPVSSIFRVKKFLERGWRITAAQQLKIMWQISEVDLTDPQTLREQLTGVDMAYMHQLVEALSGVDPEKTNSAYVSKIIDRIFG